MRVSPIIPGFSPVRLLITLSLWLTAIAVAENPPPADMTHLQPGTKVVVDWGGDRIGEFIGYTPLGWLRVRLKGNAGMIQTPVFQPARVRLATDADSNLPPAPPPATPYPVGTPPSGAPDSSGALGATGRRFEHIMPNGSPKPVVHYNYKMGDKVTVALTIGRPTIWRAEGEFVSYDRGGYALVLVREGKGRTETLRVPLSSVRPLKTGEPPTDAPPDATPAPATPPSIPPADADAPKKNTI